MINEKESTRISKVRVWCYATNLRPLELNSNGWTDVETLISKINKTDISLGVDILKYIVETNPKKRFAFNETFDKIRANQGHSVEVNQVTKATTNSISWHRRKVNFTNT